MIDVGEKKNRIISFLKVSGPSLPVRIARAISMEPVFASAILSELLGEKKIKTSNLRVGSSPLYLIPGDEKKLEEHVDNLKPVEKEAFLKLREKKVLRDELEGPSFRVALRNIKDYAVPFRFNDKILWKYAFVSDEDVREILSGEKKPVVKEDIGLGKSSLGVLQNREREIVGKIFEPKVENKKVELKKENLKVETKKEADSLKKVENIFEEGLEENSGFLSEVKLFLDKKGIEIIEKIQSDKREVVATVKMVCSVGDLNFIMIAKNKKSTNKDEIRSALQRANYSKMPCLFLLRDELKGGVLKFVSGNSLIRFLVLE
ncbi:MAG: hypothetical protein ABIF88_02425 [archaeon]